MLLLFDYGDYVGITTRLEQRNKDHKFNQTTDNFFLFPIKIHNTTLAHTLLIENSLLLFFDEYKDIVNKDTKLKIKTEFDPKKWDHSVLLYFMSLTSVQFILTYCR